MLNDRIISKEPENKVYSAEVHPTYAESTEILTFYLKANRKYLFIGGAESSIDNSALVLAYFAVRSGTLKNAIGLTPITRGTMESGGGQTCWGYAETLTEMRVALMTYGDVSGNDTYKIRGNVCVIDLLGGGSLKDVYLRLAAISLRRWHEC